MIILIGTDGNYYKGRDQPSAEFLNSLFQTIRSATPQNNSNSNNNSNNNNNNNSSPNSNNNNNNGNNNSNSNNSTGILRPKTSPSTPSIPSNFSGHSNNPSLLLQTKKLRAKPNNGNTNNNNTSNSMSIQNSSRPKSAGFS